MSGILLAFVGNSYGSLPVNTVAPAITGTATIGSTLTSSTGTWTGAPDPTFTYQWQRNTSNISGATSNTYTVTLSDAGNTLRCVVTATNPSGAVSANTASTSSVPLPTIGSALEGGYYAGQISTTANNVATHYLIVSPRSTGQLEDSAWKTNSTDTSGTTSLIDGPTNTANMDNATHPAAQFCAGLTIGGYSDWYSPAKNELEICYYNLKPTTNGNRTLDGDGVNVNAVPIRNSKYTESVPAQTSVTIFKENGTQSFEPSGNWWSSSAVGASNPGSAWSQSFTNGGQSTNGYTTELRIRAVRRVAV